MQPDLLITTIALLLAGVIAPALKHKIVAWPRFLASLQAYRIVPAALVPLAGGVLVVVESGLLVALLVSPLLSSLSVVAVQMTFVVSGLLLLLYLVAMAINLARGRSSIDCGCGDEPTRLGGGVLLRNFVLVLLACVAVLSSQHAAGASVIEILLGVGFAVIGLCLYQAAEQLLHNRTTHQRLWLGM